MTKKIVLEFIFDERVRDVGDFVDLVLKDIKISDSTTLSKYERQVIAEHWGQSDSWHVDIHNDILDVIYNGKAVGY